LDIKTDLDMVTNKKFDTTKNIKLRTMILDFFNCIAVLLAFFSFDGLGTKQIDAGALQGGRTQRVQRVVVG